MTEETEEEFLKKVYDVEMWWRKHADLPVPTYENWRSRLTKIK